MDRHSALCPTFARPIDLGQSPGKLLHLLVVYGPSILATIGTFQRQPITLLAIGRRRTPFQRFDGVCYMRQQAALGGDVALARDVPATPVGAIEERGDAHRSPGSKGISQSLVRRHDLY